MERKNEDLKESEGIKKSWQEHREELSRKMS